MMFPIGKNRCSRRNPRAAALLGLASAMMFLIAVLIQRDDGAHWRVAVAGVVCFGLVVLAVARLIRQNRDGG